MTGIGPIIAAIGRFLERHYKFPATEQQRAAAEAAVKLASVRECERRHYEYFEEIYYTEEKRRDSFATTSSFLLGLMGAAGAISAFYLRDVTDWMPGTAAAAIIKDWTAWLYLALLATGLGLLGRASYLLIRGLYGYTYQYLATPLQIREYYRTLLTFYNNPIEAETAFQAYLTDEYAAAADTNDQNNITRRKYHHRCTGTTIALFICLALTFILFFAHKLVHRERQPLLIKWANEPISLNHAYGKYFKPLGFDKAWPSMELSLSILNPDGKKTDAPFKASATDPSHSPEAQTPRSTTTEGNKGIIREKN